MPIQNTSKITKVDRRQPMLHQHGHKIQQYGKLRDLPFAKRLGTRIALSPDPRTERGTLVNQILADTIILYHLYKKQFVM